MAGSKYRSPETRARISAGMKKAPHFRRVEGDRKISSAGYVEIRDSRSSSGWMLEHRLVMEEQLGRELLSSEVVHHIDHDRTNNEPSNLMLFESQAAHRQFHLENEQP